MAHDLDRRTFVATLGVLPILSLSGCAGQKLSLVDAIRELLTISSQRAFATLIRENGFFNSQIAQISLPEALGGARGSRIINSLLNTDAFRSRLIRQVNRAAEKGAELAAPIVANAIQSVSIDDAVSLVRGNPEAATLFLKDKMGIALFTAMVPGIDQGLHLFDSTAIQQGLRVATGIDFAALRDDVSRKASDAIYRAIGKEEAAIRANPQETNSPLLAAVFGLAKRL